MYTALSLLYDFLDTAGSIVVVVTPLISLMIHQKEK